MNVTLEYEVNAGIGPQLVLLGTLIGSLLVGTLLYFLGSEIINQDIYSDSLAVNLGETDSIPDAETYNTVMEIKNCEVSDNYSPKILQWCREITQFSAKYGLPADLIAAVMLQESGGDPNAYSHSGAVGLMQVMPRDGIASKFMCANGPCFTNRPSIQELQNPEFNIEYGTRMLANLINKYGNIRDALKFYGPKDVGYTYADKVMAIYERFR